MKKNILKSLLGLGLFVASFSGIFNITMGIGVEGSDNPLGDTANPYVKKYEEDNKSDMQETLRQETNNAGMLDAFLNIFEIDKYPGAPKFILYVKTIINIALGLLSFVALIMTIYTFYMMFFTDNEAGKKKAKGNLVGIFIVLGMIGLSWIIVSFIFWWYESNWKGADGMGYVSYNSRILFENYLYV